MDTVDRRLPEQQRPAGEVSPGTTRALEREGTWADVVAAQEDMQERLRPQWWYHLLGAAVALGLFSTLWRFDDLGPWYWILLMVAILLPMLDYSVRRAIPRAWSGPEVAFRVGLTVLVVVIVAVLAIVSDTVADWFREHALLAAAIFAVLFLLLALAGAQSQQRFLRSAGERLTRRGRKEAEPSAPQRVEPLRSSAALGATMRLGLAREVHVDALRQDMGMTVGQLDEVLSALSAERLVSAHSKLLVGGRNSTWVALTPGGERALRSHLAAMTAEAR